MLAGRSCTSMDLEFHAASSTVLQGAFVSLGPVLKAARAATKKLRATEWDIPTLCCRVSCGACLTAGPGSGPSFQSVNRVFRNLHIKQTTPLTTHSNRENRNRGKGFPR